MQKVTKLVDVGVHEHGVSLMTTLGTSAGNIVLEFEPAMLEQMIADLIAALSRPEYRKTQNAMGVISAAEPRRSRVAPDQSGKAVLLSFQMESGLEHHFALPTQEASQIAHKIQRAATAQKTANRVRSH
ncbi:hypothetical protein [Mesorhizobium sp.]|uniref:hypothetical protein n=1 Tax=Mesorhizobium sp. TaxID=1871066 RepID=UPI000FE548BD|nr:hypothetical protein [Mesorhizobium sp.]RWP66250.1 MAG: hypothetical protein EOR09_33185 [Mesorhizobium sp.]